MPDYDRSPAFIALDSVSDAVAIIRDKRIVYSNRRFSAIAGGDCTGKRATSVFNPDFVRRFLYDTPPTGAAVSFTGMHLNGIQTDGNITYDNDTIIVAVHPADTQPSFNYSAASERLDFDIRSALTSLTLAIRGASSDADRRTASHIMRCICQILDYSSRVSVIMTADDSISPPPVLTDIVQTFSETCEMISPMLSDLGFLLNCSVGHFSGQVNMLRYDLEKIILSLISDSLSRMTPPDALDVSLSILRSASPMALITVKDAGISPDCPKCTGDDSRLVHSIIAKTLHPIRGSIFFESTSTSNTAIVTIPLSEAENFPASSGVQPESGIPEAYISLSRVLSDSAYSALLD